MKRETSWWRQRQIRHRDAVILGIISGLLLLAGEIGDSNIPNTYQTYIAPYLTQPPAQLAIILLLVLLGFTTYFGGIFVLLGALHFYLGRVGRGRFLLGLGLGVGFLGLASRLARTMLAQGQPFGDPIQALLTILAGLTGLGILFGLVSHALMGRYALMLKKHAKRVYRRWKRGRQATPKE